MAQEIVGSNPIARPIIHPLNNAPVAQWIEYLASNQGVAGSSPAGRTIFLETKSLLAECQGLFFLRTCDNNATSLFLCISCLSP